jgi:hypothetical protein
MKALPAHPCEPHNVDAVAQARRLGYEEFYHEASLESARLRSTALERVGFQTLLAPASDGYLVLARKPAASPNGR